MSVWFPPYRWDDDPTKRALRRRIHTAHNVCLERASTVQSDEAARHFLEAMHVASSWLYQWATEDQLAEVVVLLTLLWNAAEAAERLEAANG